MANGKRKLEIIIAGNAKGAQKAFAATKKGAKGVGKAFKGLGIVGAAGLAVAGVAVFKFGDAFNKAKNDIGRATGATGEALDGLYSDFKATLGNVPDDMATVSGALGAANTLFAATGDELSTLTERVLDMSRMAGGDATSNMEALGKASKAFGLNTEEATAATDNLFKVTQDYAIGADVLLKNIGKYGPIFSTAGFSMDETAAIMGQLNAAGVDLRKTVPGIEQFTAASVKAGKDPKKAMAAVEEQIRNAASSTDALAIAQKAFGTSAPFMVSAIRDSGVAFADAGKVLGDNAGLLSDTAKATASMGEKFKEFKNKDLVLLEPVITRMFGALMTGMDWISARGIPAVQGLIAVFKAGGLAGVLALVKTKVVEMWPAIKAALGNMAAGFVAWIEKVGPPMLAKLADLGGQLLGWLADMIPVWVSKLADLGKEFVAWIGPQIPPLLREAGQLFGKLFDWLLDEGLPLAARKLAEFGQAFAAWVGPMIPPTLKELAKLLFAIGKWIVTDATPKLLGKLAAWTGALIKWVTTDAIPKLVAKLPGIARALGRWIRDDAAPAILRWLSTWSGTFIGWVKELPAKLASAGAGMFDFIKESYRSAINFVIRGWNSLSFRIPGFDPPGPGPKFGGFTLRLPRIPELHAGGTFLPPAGQREGVALLRRGERVLTPGQASAGAGGGSGGDLVLNVDGRTWARINRDLLIQLSNSEGPMPIRIAT